jgi:4-methyl-5(b-hydroxyethyl)-thiazole monophosphate biosynthesis
MNILVPLADGFEEVEAITIIDVLRRADLALTTASLTDDKQVEGLHNVMIQADALLKDLKPDDFDAIVLPGGGRGTDNLMKDPRIIETVQSYNAQNKHICAICAAPTVLAAAGVLKGLKATCYPTCAKVLGSSYAESPVIADNNIITSQGPGTAMLFSLILVHHFAGEESARSVAKAMLSSY